MVGLVVRLRVVRARGFVRVRWIEFCEDFVVADGGAVKLRLLFKGRFDNRVEFFDIVLRFFNAFSEVLFHGIEAAQRVFDRLDRAGRALFVHAEFVFSAALQEGPAVHLLRRGCHIDIKSAEAAHFFGFLRARLCDLSVSGNERVSGLFPVCVVLSADADDELVSRDVLSDFQVCTDVFELRFGESDLVLHLMLACHGVLDGMRIFRFQRKQTGELV